MSNQLCCCSVDTWYAAHSNTSEKSCLQTSFGNTSLCDMACKVVSTVVCFHVRMIRFGGPSRMSIQEACLHHVAVARPPKLSETILSTVGTVPFWENKKKLRFVIRHFVSNYHHEVWIDQTHRLLNSKCQRKCHTMRHVTRMCINRLATVMFTSECRTSAFCPLAMGLTGLTPSLQAATVSLPSERKKTPQQWRLHFSISPAPDTRPNGMALKPLQQ